MARKATPSTPALAPASKPSAKTPAATAKSANKRGAAAKSVEPAPAPATPSPPAKAAVITIKQLAGQLAERHELPPKQAQAMLDGMIGLLVEHLKAGDRLRLNGLGVLEVKDRPARTGRNPATGVAVQIAASKKIAFRPAKELKEAI